MNDKLLELLKEIKTNKFKFSEDIDKIKLVWDLAENIGNHDSYVRDGLVYPTIANLLYYDNLPKETLVDVTKLLISDKGMKYDMPNYYELSVLTRSFSVLALVLIVYRQRNEQILSHELFMELYTEFMDYFRNETDYRGHIEEIGWAHSVAHSADLFKQLFKCGELGEEEFKLMLEYIKARFMINTYVYISDEDERMVTALIEGIKRNVLTESYLVDWIKGFKSYERLAKYPEDYNVDINVRNLLRSLYFRMIGNDEYSVLLETLVEVIDELNTHKKKKID